MAIAADQLYLSLSHSNGSTHDEQLISTAAVGLGPPWPQAAFWGPVGPATPTLTLTPVTQTALPLSTATLTAALTDPATSTAVSNTLLGFRVKTGPDIGRNGACSPANCQTDMSGHVLFNITGIGFGDDTVQAFVDSNANGSPDLGEPQATAMIHWTTPPPRPYVAMGDSFSAGEGVPPYETISGLDGCHRSFDSYSRRLAAGFPLLQPNYVACSGALVQDLYLGRYGEAPQFDALADDTKVITLTIGGNDAGFPDILGHCVSGPGTSDKECQSFGKERVELGLAHLTQGYTFCPGTDPSLCVHFPALHDVYAAIHARAKNARIYVVNYPSMFADKANKDCTVLPPYKVKVANQKWMAKQGVALDKVIKSEIALAQAKLVPVVPVDVTVSFYGHELCGFLGQPWFNGLWLKALAPLPESFHPNKLGHEAMFAALKAKPGASGWFS